MPRRKRSTRWEETKPPTAAADFSASWKAAANMEFEEIDKWFYTYADGSSGLIEPDGVLHLCSDLEIDYTDVRILLLAWKMQAKKQGFFTLEEWRKGIKDLNVDTIERLKQTITKLVDEVKHYSTMLLDFYTYAFKYNLTEFSEKSVDKETCCTLLENILGSKFQSQIAKLIQYLMCQTEYKALNMDQWLGVYRFCQEISFPDCSNYGEEDAWPVILDDFVQMVKTTSIGAI
ncbi:hypothetical protein DM860_010189 [Cuscuta australis]|uniref:Defective in cullin neddylation protein n=1 Tax=Cuscuta australis TaxID=267555 RepID=A0A328D6P2_9ASTE|nr:hypothetical protein DM860_010189 [Cuscuta australis]